MELLGLLRLGGLGGGPLAQGVCSVGRLFPNVLGLQESPWVCSPDPGLRPQPEVSVPPELTLRFMWYLLGVKGLQQACQTPGLGGSPTDSGTLSKTIDQI